MDNNYIFNKLLRLTSIDRDKKLLVDLFKLGGYEASKEQCNRWKIKGDYNRRRVDMPNEALEAFIQGIFVYRDLKRKQNIEVFNFGIKLSENRTSSSNKNSNNFIASTKRWFKNL